MLCSPGAERIFLLQVWKWKTLAFRIPLTIESLIGSSSPRPQMPLTLSYFYLWSLNTFTELSCLEHADIHLGERLGNPQTVSLSAESTVVIGFSLSASQQQLFCLLLLLFFSCVSIKKCRQAVCDVPEKNDWCCRESHLSPTLLIPLGSVRLPLWSMRLLPLEWQTQRGAARETESGQSRGSTIGFPFNYSRDWACARAAAGLLIFPEALMCILLMK